MTRAVGALVVVAALLGTGAADAQTASSAGQLNGLQHALLKPFKGDWDQIKQRRILRALVAYSRTLYFVDRGMQRGATYEALKAFENDVNKQLGAMALKFNVIFIPVSRDELIPALLDGRGDIAAASLTSTPEREQLVDFSEPFVSNVSEIVVTGASSPRISSVDDLAGKVVHLRKSSSYWEHLEGLNQRMVKEGKPPVKLVPASEDLEDEDLLEMVNAGLIPIMVCDDFKARFWKQILKKLNVEPPIAVSTSGSIGWMMRKNSPKLKAVIDAFVKTHKQGTEFGNLLIQRYQKSARYVLEATESKELRKYQQTVDLFRKYAGKYDIDYLLMMAQGYQESRLDQQVKSPVGAVGVMQLMPDTGKQMQVGDIAELEPNIHAGVKYLRYVEDTYFSDAAMDPMVKALFAFASYNAGPNRIQSLRKEAARRGLDPNRWFKNVEYVAAEKIGQETVTYVSNIFKYYIAYQLVAQAEQEREAAKQQMESGKP